MFSKVKHLLNASLYKLIPDTFTRQKISGYNRIAFFQTDTTHIKMNFIQVYGQKFGVST